MIYKYNYFSDINKDSYMTSITMFVMTFIMASISAADPWCLAVATEVQCCGGGGGSRTEPGCCMAVVVAKVPGRVATELRRSSTVSFERLEMNRYICICIKNAYIPYIYMYKYNYLYDIYK